MHCLKVLAVSLVVASAFAQAPAPKPKRPAPAAAAAQPAAAQPVLVVGDEKLTAREFDAFLSALPEQVQQQAQGAGKRQVAEQLVQIKLLAQEAKRRKLDQSPQYLAQLSFQKENLLAGLLFQDLTATLKIEEADARAYYEEHKSEYEQARARHILIKFKGSPLPSKEGKPELTDEEALAKVQQLRTRINGGEDFAAIAKAESDDTVSGGEGGDLGFFTRGQMVREFDEVAFSLPAGQLSDPVKTRFGYHLIRVEQRGAKTFDELRPDVEKKLRPELTRKVLDGLRQQSNVTIDEEFFKK
ncbi:MAG: peptidylprolyl isomerase [Bryobacteraceae bacterium]